MSENKFYPDHIKHMVGVIAATLDVSVEDVHEFVNENPIKYSDLRDCILHLGVLPTIEEAKFIGEFGIDHFLNLKGVAI